MTPWNLTSFCLKGAKDNLNVCVKALCNTFLNELNVKFRQLKKKKQIINNMRKRETDRNYIEILAPNCCHPFPFDKVAQITQIIGL